MTEVLTLPIRSMTGFGAAERVGRDLIVRVEIRSVNARHLKLSTRVPSVLEPHVSDVEERVRRRVSRGTVHVGIRLEREARGAPGRIVDSVLLDYLDQLRGLARKAQVDPPTGVQHLLDLPGVVVESGEAGIGRAELEVVLEVVGQALDRLVTMREREGTAAAADFETHLSRIELLCDAIEERLPELVAEHHQRLKSRLDALLDGKRPMAEEVLAREIAVLADKTDVAEELSRLRTHVEGWRGALRDGGVVGRRLEFLAQEMGREANTTGAKVSDAQATADVVELKLAVERLKEQAANVE